MLNIGQLKKNSLRNNNIEDYKCVTRRNKSVYFTSPLLPSEDTPNDVQIIYNQFFNRNWYNIICLNHNNTNKCYCGKQFEGTHCNTSKFKYILITYLI